MVHWVVCISMLKFCLTHKSANQNAGFNYMYVSCGLIKRISQQLCMLCEQFSSIDLNIKILKKSGQVFWISEVLFLSLQGDVYQKRE